MDERIFILIFVPAFIAGWIGICFALSSLGGWMRLATAFRATSEPSGRRFLWRYGAVGIVHYRACLNIWSSPTGVFLTVSGIFRPGHPRLFIPRSAIKAIRTRRFLFSNQAEVEVDTGMAGQVRLRLPAAALAACGPGD